MKAKLIYEKLSNFTEESDPIRDMGIGLNPDEVSQNFALKFEREFGQTIYYNECGSDFDLAEDDVYRVGEESFTDENHPLAKLFCGKDHELDFAVTNRAANGIVEGSTWGWFYYVRGHAYHLKGAYDFEDVIKQMCNVAGISSHQLTKKINKYQGYVDFLEKLQKYTG